MTDNPTTYEVIIGTDVTSTEPNASELAVARAVNELREGWIQEILHASVFTGSDPDTQYGVRLELTSVEPPEVFERHAETVEVV